MNLDPRFGIVADTSDKTDIPVTGVKMGSQRKIDDVGMIMAGSEHTNLESVVLLSLTIFYQTPLSPVRHSC